MVVQANAKLNLVLNVSKNKTNNYHELESLMVPISLHDAVDIVKLRDASTTYVTCDTFELAGEGYNIVSKAIDIMRKKYNFKDHFRIVIYKRVFISAGLGGGSSDAAAVIKGLNKMLKLNMSLQDMIEVGLQVGSDVPFFLSNKPAIVKGIGNSVTLVNDRMKKKYYGIVVQPSKGVSTKESYAKFDEIGISNETNIDNVIEAYDKGEEALGKAITNDLEIPSIELVPEIKELKTSLINDGLKCVMMSGSGSSVFGLTSSKKEVLKLFKKYYEAGYKAEIFKTI